MDLVTLKERTADPGAINHRGKTRTESGLEFSS